MAFDDSSSILIDKTATVVEVTSGDTYIIVIYGETVGDFDTDIVAFIDWNQTKILDDANEVYEIGTLSNSTIRKSTVYRKIATFRRKRVFTKKEQV